MKTRRESQEKKKARQINKINICGVIARLKKIYSQFIILDLIEKQHEGTNECESD